MHTLNRFDYLIHFFFLITTFSTTIAKATTVFIKSVCNSLPFDCMYRFKGKTNKIAYHQEHFGSALLIIGYQRYNVIETKQ